ncbi:hypothetical protein PoMZ_01715 [Pyricularia oryzae]|uniref:Uncharacterized protein n=1 Tax=Pyricularia oryzae TaxID=318829 RepID=A0A4P7N314_PYROR|nr:hypothetical protein PoMZ_01715 [Pyricularia oryzae]
MPENVTIVWENSLDERVRPRNQWVTNVMGRFTCRNRQCASGGWFSRTVGIWIRQFRGGALRTNKSFARDAGGEWVNYPAGINSGAAFRS